jgi:hypothetical protein
MVIMYKYKLQCNIYNENVGWLVLCSDNIITNLDYKASFQYYIN